MSFIREAVRDKPVIVCAMDDTSPFQDYSGFNRTASSSGGTPPKHVSLIADTDYAPVFSSTITATLAAPVFYQGLEALPFSLEATVRVVSTDGTFSEQQILGNLNQLDGLTVNGNVVSFVVKFDGADEVRVTYDAQQGQRLHIVGVKVKDKISLFVNGKLAGESSLTEAQQASLYVTSDANLYCGATTGTQRIAVAGLAAYPVALDQTAITRHYLAATTLPDGEDVASAFRGDRIPLGLGNTSLFLDQWWSSDLDWNSAQLRDTAVVNGQLRPQFDGDTSIPGSWIDTFALDAAEGTSVYGVSLNWDGEGIVIEASLDGNTWEVAQRGVNLALIPEGFDPTDKELQLRVTFAGGVVEDTSFLDNLNAVGIKTAATPPVAGRTVTYANAYPEREYFPLDLHDNWGVEIASGGTVTISADTSDDASPIRTLEVWIKRTAATNPTLSITGTTYQNGESGTSTLVRGQWTLLHVVAASDVTTGLTITGPAQVGQVTVYDSALTADDIADIYSQYTLNSPTVVVDNSVVGLTESTSPVNIYAHDWSIEGAG